MYCTLCFTAYSYDTGKVVTGAIHNPHYFERMRRLHNGVVPPQTAQPPACALTISELYHHPATRETHIRSRAVRLGSHIDYFYLRNVGGIDYLATPDVPLNNEQLRVKYMANELTEKQFKQKIERAERKYQRDIEVRGVYTLYVTLVTDYMNGRPTVEGDQELVKMVDEFVNTPLRSIVQRYKGIVEIVNIGTDKMEKIRAISPSKATKVTCPCGQCTRIRKCTATTAPALPTPTPAPPRAVGGAGREEDYLLPSPAKYGAQDSDGEDGDYESDYE
jgi:hypothetical protein